MVFYQNIDILSIPRLEKVIYNINLKSHSISCSNK